ncbi:MAG: hypothetical protein P9M03_02350 [Candidatus Theseobacter exili]|nr:hypothetical protein [Candidatus Theseobacter exili]
MLVKGPCDVSQMLAFFSNEAIFETEFAYVSLLKEGMYIESFNHTSQILLAASLSLSEREELIATVPFIDDEYFDTKLLQREYRHVIFSMLTDYGLGLYRNKQNPKFTVAFGQYTIDYTKKENWDSIVNFWMKGSPSNERIAKEYDFFQENYEYLGRSSQQNMVDNLQCIRDRLPAQTKMIFLDGAEVPYHGSTKVSLAGRELQHKELNKVLSGFVERNNTNCHIIHVTDYFTDDDPYLDTINHYKKIVYYRLAEAIQAYISSVDSEVRLHTKNRTILYAKYLFHKLRGIVSGSKVLLYCCLKKNNYPVSR